VKFTRHDWHVVLLSTLAIAAPIALIDAAAGGLPQSILVALVAVGMLLAVAVTAHVERKHH
jgi:4-amino-4-deoxy-L-arabinose transferase-like glycosyltransferase